MTNHAKAFEDKNNEYRKVHETGVSNEERNVHLSQVGLFCPNCGGPLEGRKCKLFCYKPGCGYLVTCSEW